MVIVGIPWSPISHDSLSNIHKLSSVEYLDITGSQVAEEELQRILSLFIYIAISSTATFIHIHLT